MITIQTDVNSKGYGMIPKLVMQDKSLSPYAKAIYSYLKSYCGNKNECFPSVDKICRDVGMCRHTFDKYVKTLVNMGYIKKRQIKDKGKYSRNVYTICEFLGSKTVDVHDLAVHNSDVGKKPPNNNKINKNSNNKNTLSKKASEKKKKYDFDFEDIYEKP